MKMKSRKVQGTILLVSALALLAGCAGPGARSSANEEYVEIANPAFTSSPNAPETIWVPRRYVEKGPQRGTQLVKQGIQAVRDPQSGGSASKEIAPRAPEPQPAGEMPRAPEPFAGEVKGPVGMIPHYGMVVALDREQVIFNLGKNAGIKPGQKLKVYRGGTVVEGLGLAPGALVATVEVLGFVGTQGAYGIVKQGGPVQKNDLIGLE